MAKELFTGRELPPSPYDNAGYNSDITPSDDVVTGTLKGIPRVIGSAIDSVGMVGAQAMVGAKNAALALEHIPGKASNAIADKLVALDPNLKGTAYDTGAQPDAKGMVSKGAVSSSQSAPSTPPAVQADKPSADAPATPPAETHHQLTKKAVAYFASHTPGEVQKVDDNITAAAAALPNPVVLGEPQDHHIQRVTPDGTIVSTRVQGGPATEADVARSVLTSMQQSIKGAIDSGHIGVAKDLYTEMQPVQAAVTLLHNREVNQSLNNLQALQMRDDVSPADKIGSVIEIYNKIPNGQDLHFEDSPQGKVLVTTHPNGSTTKSLVTPKLADQVLKGAIRYGQAEYTDQDLKQKGIEATTAASNASAANSTAEATTGMKIKQQLADQNGAYQRSLITSSNDQHEAYAGEKQEKARRLALLNDVDTELGKPGLDPSRRSELMQFKESLVPASQSDLIKIGVDPMSGEIQYGSRSGMAGKGTQVAPKSGHAANALEEIQLRAAAAKKGM